MKKFLFAILFMTAGCDDQMSRCKDTCATAGVAKVTAYKCICNMPSNMPEPRADGGSDAHEGR